MKRSIDTTRELISRDLLRASFMSLSLPPEDSDPNVPKNTEWEYTIDNMNTRARTCARYFASPYATADQSYRIFKNGLISLAQAMNK